MEKTASKANGAKGYVIIGGFYPWVKIPELVIGRHGFIDVIVNLAKAHDAKIIDTTSSLLAVHQPVKIGTGTQSTGKDADFNVNAVVNMYGLAKMSMINMMPEHYKTTADFLGNIYIIHNRVAPKAAVKAKIAMKKKETKKPEAKSETHDATGQGKKSEIKKETKGKTKQSQAIKNLIKPPETKKPEAKSETHDANGQEKKSEVKKKTKGDTNQSQATKYLIKPPATDQRQANKTRPLFGYKIRGKV